MTFSTRPSGSDENESRRSQGEHSIREDGATIELPAEQTSWGRQERDWDRGGLAFPPSI
jgi:hypothetical protein